MSKKAGSAFGRDEMNLLLGVSGGDDSKAGIGTAGTSLLQGRGFEQRKSKSTGEVDIASLSTAQTAALLQQQQQSKGAPISTSRHRARRSKKRMNHHALLEQELRAEQVHQQSATRHHEQNEQKVASSESESEEENYFSAPQHTKKPSNRRIQLEPQIVAQKDAPQTQRRRLRKQRSSSSSSSDSEESTAGPRRRVRKDSSSPEGEEPTTRRRRRRSPSASSSSSSEDEHRQRRLKKCQQLRNDNKKNEKITNVDNKAEHPTESEPIPGTSKVEKKAPPAKQRPGRKESSSESSSGSSSGSDSSSSSEEDPSRAMAKPLFVPKRKRIQLAQEKLESEQSLKNQELKSKKEEERKRMESRALVAQVVAAGTITTNDDVMSEDEELVASRMLDDEDNKEEDRERDLWEVRELERLLTEIDRLRQKEQKEADYRRRQQLTDEQAREEDIASGRYQQPGSNRMQQVDSKYQQKYFHRGAYYMDEDEFAEDDVRRRAKEYEQGVTESARSRGDTRNLPKVMQVKQFGRANQSRYQGLAKEDSSTKESSTLLPLVVHRKKQKNTTDAGIPTNKRNRK